MRMVGLPRNDSCFAKIFISVDALFSSFWSLNSHWDCFQQHVLVLKEREGKNKRSEFGSFHFFCALYSKNAQNGRFHRPLVQFASPWNHRSPEFKSKFIHHGVRFGRTRQWNKVKKRCLNPLFDWQSCTGHHVGSSLSRPLIFFEWIALDVLFFTVLVRLVYVREVGNAARSTTTVEDATQIELLQTGFGWILGHKSWINWSVTLGRRLKRKKR